MVPTGFPDFRPKPFNEEFYNGSGNGIYEMGKVVGADGLYGDGTFEKVMLRALDRVNGFQQNADAIHQQMIVDPESLDPHEISNAEAMASMSLNITRTILNRVVQAWKDIINTR
jgi:flagellar hook-basal body complex protein FliE